MSFPYCVGQIPVYYNHLSTGRKDFPECDDHFRSRYIDIPNEPLYSFGYGLSYTKFEIKTELSSENHIAASVTVKNVGEYAGAETLQLYIQDVTASVVRPVKELKGFQKVYLKKGESREVLFSINEVSFVQMAQMEVNLVFSAYGLAIQVKWNSIKSFIYCNEKGGEMKERTGGYGV